jgi:hypothetical protein
MTPLETKVRDVLETIVPGTLIRMNQNKPRQQLPYTAWMINGSRAEGMDEYSAPKDSGEQTVSGNREFTLTIQHYSENGPVEFLQNIRDKLSLVSVMDAFLVRGISAYSATKVDDISMKLETQIEPRATMDVFCRYRSSIIDMVGVIETANITGTDDGVNSPTYTVVASV